MLQRSAENLAELSLRGARLARSARLVGVTCSECAHPYLYDENNDRLFLDPSDLSVVVDGTEGDEFPPCCGCSQPDWSFVDVVGEQESDGFAAGAWSFAFWAPPPAAAKAERPIALTVAAVFLLVLGAAALAFNPDPLAGPAKARPHAKTPGG